MSWLRGTILHPLSSPVPSSVFPCTRSCEADAETLGHIKCFQYTMQFSLYLLCFGCLLSSPAHFLNDACTLQYSMQFSSPCQILFLGPHHHCHHNNSTATALPAVASQFAQDLHYFFYRSARVRLNTVCKLLCNFNADHVDVYHCW